MKFLIKKIYIISFLLTVFLIQPEAFARASKTQYSGEKISNYFLGMLFVKNDQNNEALKYLNKVQLLKDRHSKYNVEFLRTLVLLGKFDKAIDFSELGISTPTHIIFFSLLSLALSMTSFISSWYLS